jgi:S-DNA-T family DNA segregation ATPase FtsK/SpoIIIE
LEFTGIALAFTSFYIILSLATYNAIDPSFNHAAPINAIHNSGGVIGAFLSDILFQNFGYASYTLPIVLGFTAILLLSHTPIPHPAIIIAITPLLIVNIDVIYHVLVPEITAPEGGLTGRFVTSILMLFLGKFGTFTLSALTIALCVMWLSGLTVQDLYSYTLKAVWLVKQFATILVRTLKRIKFNKSIQFDLPLPTPPIKKLKPKVERIRPKSNTASRVESEKQEGLPLNLSDKYNLPPLHLLGDIKPSGKDETEEALNQNAKQLEKQLENFGVKGSITKICPGPVITIYELEPAAGVKTSTVVGLADDLARAMSAMAIRIAPIPGRTVIGIEMPNAHRKTVTLKELLETENFEANPGKLTVALGVDTAGTPTYADISTMPHVLIAGTTGSGKSVAMNAFILSLLYRLSPEQLRLIMVDPKMLELSGYNDIPHLLTPVITDPNKASAALKWATKEMERRYKMMADFGVKNIQSFNAKFAEFQQREEIPTRVVQTGFEPSTGKPIMEEQPLCDAPLPYIVIIIDELSDLMMVAGKQVEQSIARLAQMARAAGMHLLVATQRPSVDVVTGLIKANIPTRMSFNVTSRIDSRTVLDQMGAEQLLGKGDMLYMGNGSTGLERMHGAFVTEEECIAVSEYIKKQSEPNYVEDMFSEAGEGGGIGASDVSDDDPLYHQAIEIVAREQKASTSFIQRHLKIGYNRAASLIDKMEADGLIGAANHVGKREVIVRETPEGGY